MIAEHFDHLQDPRRAQGRRHRLDHVLTIALCAVVTGSDGWDDIAVFAEAWEPWLTERLGLPHGTPSADTVRRVISAIEPEAFERGFARWVEGVATKTAGELVAIDGKSLRRSYDKDDPKAMLHMVSAWASGQGLVLAQQAVDAKSNEINAIPALLGVLDVRGCIVTIDAMGTQTEIAAQIRGRGADYVLALKGNHEALHDDVRDYFETLASVPGRSAFACYAETADVGHGRKEIRRLWASEDLDWLIQKSAWSGLRSIVRVESERHVGGVVTRQRRYFISSLGASSAADAEHLLGCVRGHWGIENRIHWVLDVVFREDESRVRRDHGAANLSVLRRLSLNLLRRATTKRKLSLRMKRKLAGWDVAFLAAVVGI
jgi:predicted transposase YbfD/YdcC